MRFLGFNIQYGFGSDGRYDLPRVADVLRDADVICLQEVERNWTRSGMDDQPALLSAMLPGHYWVYGPAFDMDASTVEAGRIVNRRRQFGTMILSRLPIVWSRLWPLPKRRMVDPLNTQNAALEAMIRTPAGPVRVLSVHLAHVGVEERLEEIDFLLSLHARAPLEGGPWSGTDDEPARNWTEGEPEPENPTSAIWMGDFNCEPFSAEYTCICGATPYHPGARYSAGFVDAVAAAGLRPGSLHTHEKVIAGERRLRQLDHCFVTGDLAGRVRSVRVDNACVASDHHPLWVELDF